MINYTYVNNQAKCIETRLILQKKKKISIDYGQNEDNLERKIVSVIHLCGY